MTTYASPAGIDLHYEIYGKSNDPVVLLIMGLGAQLTSWPVEFINHLVQRKLCVICFDNRDVGLSPKLSHFGKPRLVLNAIKRTLRLPQEIPYTLDDMACDVITLMDGLKLPKAHIVGASMGGMIGQIIAAKHPDRCSSLVSMMSSPGSPVNNKPALKVLLKLLGNGRNKHNRRSIIQQNVRLNQLIGSDTYPIEESRLRQHAMNNVERCHYPEGFQRQLAAVAFSKHRAALLKRISAPTLVLHGSEDPLIPWQLGVETAIHIPKAKINIVRGMGHNIPPALCPKLAKRIAKHILKSEQKANKYSCVE